MLTQEEQQPDNISFDFIKSNFFRVVHVDGAWGGVGPRGIQMALFSERAPIPKSVEYRIGTDGLSEEVSRDVRTAVIREVEVELTMNLQTAISINEWLSSKIAEAQE